VKEFLWMYFYAVLFLTMLVAIYGIAVKPNMLKKIIMLSILSDAANVLAVVMGYRANASSPPVYPGYTFEVVDYPSKDAIVSFVNSAVDPIPQVLVVTAIVIGLAVLVFLSSILILIYRKYRTLDVRRLSSLIKEGGEWIE